MVWMKIIAAKEFPFLTVSLSNWHLTQVKTVKQHFFPVRDVQPAMKNERISGEAVVRS